MGNSLLAVRDINHKYIVVGGFYATAKEQFQNTLLKYEGLWERLTLFCMYIPFAYKSMSNLFF